MGGFFSCERLRLDAERRSGSGGFPHEGASLPSYNPHTARAGGWVCDAEPARALQIRGPISQARRSACERKCNPRPPLTFQGLARGLAERGEGKKGKKSDAAAVHGYGEHLFHV